VSYRVITDFPVALDSPDHQIPGGTMHDSSRNPRFNAKLLSLLAKRPLRVMDLGCAGGGFVKDMVDAGQDAIGLEGSDYSLKWDGPGVPDEPNPTRKPGRRAEWATIPDRLFTCDITRPFRVLQDEGFATETATFDVVTAWEVMEHLPEERLPTLIVNVLWHLEPAGLWIMSVSTQQGGPHHVTVKPREWWVALFERHGLVNDQGLVHYFGDDWIRGPNQNAPQSFHLILKRAG
jgi:SAM-dependent methyltransferase